MRIEFWIDYICPVTYLTHKNLIDAINELKITKYDLFYRSYQIDEQEFEKLLSDKTFDDLLSSNNVGLKNFDTTTIHQVAHLAKRKELALEFNELILKNIFDENNDSVSNQTVYELAKKCGMDEENIKTVIDTQCYTKQISSNKINAQGRGIKAVPHIRVNIKNNLIGYQDKESIKNFLIEILKKQPATEYCGEYCDY